MMRALEKIRERKDGMLSVEAMFSLIIFMLFMFSLYSVIFLFMAHDMIGHALMETGQSLAVQNYSAETVADAHKKNLFESAAFSLLEKLEPEDVEGEAGFYQGNVDDVTAPDVVKNSFCAYLAGTPDKADSLLQALKVQGGLSGMTFDISKTGETMSINVRYKIDLLIQMHIFGIDFGKFSGSQTVVNRLWSPPK